MTIGTGLAVETAEIVISGRTVKVRVNVNKFVCGATANDFTIEGVTISSSHASGTDRQAALSLLQSTVQKAVNTGIYAETDFSWAIVELPDDDPEDEDE